MTANLITDVAGVRVGSAHDARLASGVTAVVFDEPAVASIATHGGSPAVRDTALLEPEMTVERVDGFVLSGGSAFGLDAAGGAMAYLFEQGRGFPARGTRVPIVPGASLFDLVNGGDKAWGHSRPIGSWATAPPRRPVRFLRSAPRGRDTARTLSASRAASARRAPSRRTAFASARWLRPIRAAG